jgi:hypothetical protein
MSKDVSTERAESVEARREFIKTAGKVAVAAPAVALLLNANARRATAAPVSGGVTF